MCPARHSSLSKLYVYWTQSQARIKRRKYLIKCYTPSHVRPPLPLLYTNALFVGSRLIYVASYEHYCDTPCLQSQHLITSHCCTRMLLLVLLSRHGRMLEKVILSQRWSSMELFLPWQVVLSKSSLRLLSWCIAQQSQIIIPSVNIRCCHTTHNS